MELTKFASIFITKLFTQETEATGSSTGCRLSTSGCSSQIRKFGLTKTSRGHAISHPPQSHPPPIRHLSNRGEGPRFSPPGRLWFPAGTTTCISPVREFPKIPSLASSSLQRSSKLGSGRSISPSPLLNFRLSLFSNGARMMTAAISSSGCKSTAIRGRECLKICSLKQLELS
ncbi:2-oxoglutarate (2OG) and Fe(II)-dependent oxygenase superfamily protein [Striga asiatica]|uniref:2-oxoglutarate (2OG) and Fe(II)-dependent oxygenase superfamily protein n=1 Tax=Striga asiatica TaxID=4170 RepID=A0A5A7PL82_STRAF|nr:2-oxoglutarate (2OG) and Fe(II)-dependent oxygenase superfamily protein [Striga asiatica]